MILGVPQVPDRLFTAGRYFNAYAYAEAGAAAAQGSVVSGRE